MSLEIFVYLKMPDKSENIETGEIQEGSRTLEVKRWHDMNIKKWGEWGFSVDEIFRTPRFNFLLQRVRPVMREVSGDSHSFILEGRWFRFDESMERRLEKMSWPIIVIVMVLFSFMINEFLAHRGLNAAIIFMVMYVIIEGFSIFTMNLLARAKKLESVDIPFSRIRRIVLVSKPGVLLLGWDENGSGVGVAAGFHPETAKLILNRIKPGLDQTTDVRIVDDRNLGNPPKETK